MNNILITGGRGFIGFNAIKLWKRLRPDLTIVNVDAETYADRFMIDEKNKWFDEHSIPSFVVDLGSDYALEAIESIVDTFSIDTICHFGAESHVDNSFTGPKIFFQSNIIGTVNLLEIARKRDIRFHMVSTDEVYGIT